jgi:hypothetical protein
MTAMKWLFKLDEDYICDLNQSNLMNKDDLEQLKSELSKGEIFCAKNSSIPLMEITQDAKIIIFKGYSWDGNSPKINVLDLFWVGTPDGLMKHNKPITYFASLVHDILGQFKFSPKLPSKFRSDRSPDLWFSRGRRGRDGLYFNILKSEGFLWRHVYYLAVALAGPLYDVFLATVKQVSFESGDCSEV